MGVPSLPFLALAAVAACLFNASRVVWWRQAVLLVTNLVFLASFAHAPAELLPYAGFLAIGFVVIHGIRRGVAARVHALAAITVLVLFCWLKQYTFLPDGLFLRQPYVLVGLSYVFFRVMHLVIDAAPEDEPLGLVDYLNYTLNFAALVSGPIQRHEEYRRMTVTRPLSLDAVDAALAVERIVTGLFKISVLAVLIAMARKYFAHHALTDAAMTARARDAMALAALYPVFLFFNFSGYTDFVIGIARFFRLRLPENFDMPFSACSFIEYWSRWHMSLSNWLKTYVYNPLLTVMMRRVRAPWFMPYAGAVGLFVTFFLIGVWHGRTAAFFVFGLLNGLGMAVNQAFRIVMTARLGRKPFAALAKTFAYRFGGRGLTFTWVAFTLLWFWSDWSELAHYVAAIGAVGVAALWLGVIALSCVALEALQRLRAVALAAALGGRPMVLSRYARAAWLTIMLFLIATVQNVMNSAAPEIVYKNF